MNPCGVSTRCGPGTPARLSFLTPSAAPAGPQPGRSKAEKAAHDFEAVLLTSLLDSLQKTFAGASDDDPSGSDNYALMGTQALASAMSSRGGIGIARLILQQWQHTKVLESKETEVPVTG